MRAMGAKIELLRRLGAVEEFERRFEQDEEFGEIYDVSRLSLPAGVAGAEHLPGGTSSFLCADRMRRSSVTWSSTGTESFVRNG
ncbi:hypothetical protein NCAST_11_01000 [Nocardia asteroides NBRC 15531]|uniref:Uncharacterized protein n=2 Tax=Nocardia asteroides TaxID=1824 RepID=U5E3I7_NOCAS|nr:hypothetical protein NCAST_11_01000 [Nocardia asteroides NBRC 15531]